MAPLLRRFIFCVLIFSLLSATHAQQYAVDTLVANSNMGLPASIAFSPDNSGKFFFAERASGRVRVFSHGTAAETPFVTLPVKGTGEEGFLGIALHPDYPDSPFAFVSYTMPGDGWNVIVRYRDSSGVGVRPATIFVDSQTTFIRRGGQIHFGPDGKLYVALGDGGSSANSQDTGATNLQGKILRLNSDGSIPPDNPWPGKPFWSIGHRNCPDFTFDQQSGTMYCTEDGPGCNDEVDCVPGGGNLGWPSDFNQATCAYLGEPGFVPPLYSFPGPKLPDLTGIAVYRAQAFPRLRGEILFTGSSTPSVWTLPLTGDGDNIIPDSCGILFTSGKGFSDIEVGPDGSLCVANGSSGLSRILRLRPVAPSFVSTPPPMAVQGTPYAYSPAFAGTPPGLQIVYGPEGMFIDSSTWTLRWVPTNQQALQRLHTVRLRAENGSGVVDQEFAIAVTNVNDAPGPFELLSPPSDTTLSFVGSDPAVHFVWNSSVDPDLDTVGYTLQTDTVVTFSSPALRDTIVGTATSTTLVFPRKDANYYWRVKATDGLLTTSSSEIRRVLVSFTPPLKEEKPPGAEYRLEQNFPNPFNPATSIVYSIPISGFVRLAVFNLLGQEVALIYEGFQTEGAHEVEFRNPELPSGIYFYRIQAPNFVETRKLTILR